MLHPDHLDGILIELTPYMVPLDPLVSIQNPGPEICQEVRERELCFFLGHGGEMVRKNRVQQLLDSVFFTPFLPHVWDSVFFLQNTKKNKVLSLSHFLTFFRT